MAEKKLNAYDEFRNTLAGYSQAGQIYEKIAHIPQARELAAQLARDENDQTAEQILLNPETPIETVAQAVDLGLERKKVKLEELVENENQFAEILKGVEKDRLKASLMSYDLRENVDRKYKDLADAHKVMRILNLYENREKLKQDKPEVFNKVLAEMEKDVIAHYEKQYEVKRGDSKEAKEQKEKLKSFFISLYISREGEPIRGGLNLRSKYEEIHKDKLEEFEEKLKTKDNLVNYIKATLPKEKEVRLGYLSRLVAQE